jgi:hypothetical protein
VAIGSIQVYACSEDSIVRAIHRAPSDHHKVTERALSLARYLTSPGIQAKTIVEESEYIDRDYLEDFAGYYVSCFTEYPRRCRRLHFFSSDFDEAAFVALINGGTSSISADSLRGSYLGFVVVRPLPEARIGRTCIATYTSDGGTRRFPTVIDCHANLCGIPLKVRSVPYQEQDTVTAACATSAVWSALHVTGSKFQHRIPSPVTITQWATNGSPHRDSRSMPNHGLNMGEMLAAIRHAGLEPMTAQVSQAGPIPGVFIFI